MFNCLKDSVTSAAYAIMFYVLCSVRFLKIILHLFTLKIFFFIEEEIYNRCLNDCNRNFVCLNQ